MVCLVTWNLDACADLMPRCRGLKVLVVIDQCKSLTGWHLRLVLRFPEEPRITQGSSHSTSWTRGLTGLERAGGKAPNISSKKTADTSPQKIPKFSQYTLDMVAAIIASLTP